MKRFAGLASLLLALTPGHARGDVEHHRARVLPDEENAWTLWAPALVQCEVRIPDELSDTLRKAYSFDQIPPTGEERRRLQEWLDTLREPMAQISKGVELGKLQFPLHSVSEDKNLMAFSPLLRIARYRVAQGRFRMLDGDPAGAARQFVDAYRLGRLISEGDGFLIHRIVGDAVQSIGLHAMRHLAADRRTPIHMLEAMAAGLSAPSAEDPALAQAYRAEFTYYVRPELEIIAASLAAHPPAADGAEKTVFDRTATLRSAETFMARLIADSRKPWTRRDEKIAGDAAAPTVAVDWAEPGIAPAMVGGKLVQMIPADDHEAWQKLARNPAQGPNPRGRALIAGLVETMQDARVRALAVRVETHLTQAYLAAIIYRRKHGRLPATLAEVVATGLLPELPPDLFTNEPLHYSPVHRILRSAGPGENVRHDHLKAHLQIELPPP